VPLAPWLANELRNYLINVHPFAGKNRIPHAPLFPGRRNRYSFDWAKPVHAGSLHEHYFAQACRGCDLGSVRFHDLRHSFATMNPSAGERYMQVSKAGTLNSRTDANALRGLHQRRCAGSTKGRTRCRRFAHERNPTARKFRRLS
jgi:cytolysin (calcineurin-like family phosphatase)